jgi:hypothetical protein
MIALWKTFSVLLEFSCKTDYKMMLSKVEDRQEIEKIEL